MVMEMLTTVVVMRMMMSLDCGGKTSPAIKCARNCGSGVVENATVVEHGAANLRACRARLAVPAASLPFTLRTICLAPSIFGHGGEVVHQSTPEAEILLAWL